MLSLDPLPHDPSLDSLARELSVAANLEKIRARLSGVKVAYTDVDGTMMGPGGCFIVNARREYTLEPVRTLVRALETGLDIFLVSGRNRMGLLETARILGMKNYIAELGVETVYNLGEEVVTDYGAFEGVTDRLYDYIESLGVLDYLFERYPRRLELHTPWALKRDCTPLLRGLVDPAEVNREFARRFPGLQMVDNGIIPPLLSRPGRARDTGLSRRAGGNQQGRRGRGGHAPTWPAPGGDGGGGGFRGRPALRRKSGGLLPGAQRALRQSAYRRPHRRVR